MWCEQKITEHPCLNKEVAGKKGRVHLPVAPRCNIKCRYCSQKYDCANENRPGVASTLLKPWQAIYRLKEILEKDERISVVGIAGPGDPLANKETFETFRLVNEHAPGLLKCLSTNGLLLPDYIEEIKVLRIDSLTVTVNAVDPTIGNQIYDWVLYKGQILRGLSGASKLLSNQLMGIEAAVKHGIVVKVNTVLIPGINDHHVSEIARVMRDLGVYVMNIMPLIPQADFAHLTPPSPEELLRIRQQNRVFIPQMDHCRQCRADAIGLLGEEESNYDQKICCGQQ
ncbi:nitrogen fixation protein NifB [Carboxydocella sporoproducens DSM 16521]|uniref:FeMo cofactor biosynthesis protein NifB n=2 Tax=Carboxydocella TaxID=178898 RepID=A0A1T4PGR2_9FIRM|nr:MULTISPECIES: radical SAM protein [Carboxydocella]AVX21431.1 nitrogen fixation protein NifB [Carboxydocella thermautotrophica]SJZ89968.1 nitrogen fixation protein NifB [Carboxydocella sporoproducens DSM 16521]